jgi:hypothetical protein
MNRVLARRHWVDKRFYPVHTCFILGVLIFLLSAGGQGLCKEIVYNMKGKISAVEPANNTVVVQVPMKDGEIFTVGGPLAPDAIIRQGGRTATLADFFPGEEVTVKWKPVETGHLILMLEK